nr:MAG TPA: Hydrogenase maturation factor [Caudoviricetes sp.]
MHLEFCTNCKRAYSSEEDREFHKDMYETLD